MIKRNILLTFDYELYLGNRSGTFEKCAVEPTTALVTAMEKHDARGVFFVDTLSLMKASGQISLRAQVDLVLSQLLSLHNKGHYVFPHLHPHWNNAVFLPNLNQFSLENREHYSLASVSLKEAEHYFQKSIEFLKKTGIGYQEWGYRAGGWCIQPFARYERIFRDCNIKYEFSVLPGFLNKSHDRHFDFTAINLRTPYRFNNDITISNEEGAFTEFPISTIAISDGITNKLLKKILWKLGDRGWGDGLSAGGDNLKTAFDKEEMVSIDLLTRVTLNSYLRFLKTNEYMHWISHPKMLTKHSLRMFSMFLSEVRNNYTCEFDFLKMLPKN